MLETPISSHDQTSAAMRIADLTAEVERLKALVATLSRALFGARSERQQEMPDQPSLPLDDLSATPPEPKPLPKPTVQSRAPSRPGRRNIGNLPAHLPRYDVTIEPDTTTCPCCAGVLHKIGDDVTEQLDVVPAVLRVQRIHRPRYGCRVCETAVVQAKARPRPIDGGLPTAALLVHVAAMKFAWHLPLNRQVEMLAGQGIHLDRSTLVHWMAKLAWWLKPLHATLAATILATPKLFCDDTPLPVLDRTRRRTRIARLWAYAMDDRPWLGPAPPAVVYLFTDNRKGSTVDDHLAGFNGVLQVDAYGGYNRLTRHHRPGGVVTLAYCLAHARRKYFELFVATGCPIAAEALRRIGVIYEIEARIRGTSAENRVAVRQAETLPLIEALKPWLMDRLTEISVKSPLAKAIKYTLGLWEGLCVFLTDGRVEVDSNVVERTIRPVVMTKKNALFAGSSGGGETWAILASLINTARLNGLDPYAYLVDVLERIVSGTTKANALHELLPWIWKISKTETALAA
ncbi:IS66 family transposase [Acidiphilium sp. MT5]